MGLFLHCIGVLALLRSSQSATYGLQWWVSTGCVPCAEAECEYPATRISSCREVYKPPEGTYAEELMSYWPKIFGAQNLVADKLITCYAVTFRYDPHYMRPNVSIMRNMTNDLELHDCGPIDFCHRLVDYYLHGEPVFRHKFHIRNCTQRGQIVLPCH